jgi:dihydroorotase/N-acyl-D-amino-acid deacylase
MTTIDALIRGAKVVDGSGNPWFYGDVAIGGDRITAVAPPGRIEPANAREVVEAAGMVVAPGFIDIQSHSIVPLMRDARCLSKITQGVTTEIMGEGWTPAPFGGRIVDPMPHTLALDRDDDWAERARTWTRFGDWLDALVERGVAPNVGSFLGGGTLREYAKGLEMGPANDDELAVMRRVMAEAMADGAFGVAFALIYPPDAYVATDELVEVCRVVATLHGVYITHIRNESYQLVAALDEAIEIGRRSGAPVEIYHLKASGRDNWAAMPAAIERIDAARAAGIDVTADMYPYTASGTGLAIVLPPWAAADGKFFDNLRDPATRATIRAAALHPDGAWEAAEQETGPEGIMPVGFSLPEHQQYAGKRLSEIAAARGQLWVDAAIDLMLAEESLIPTIFFGMSEENLALQLRQPWMKVASDAGGLDPAWARAQGPTHPRAYGTFPRVLGTYVREERVMPLEDAVRKMTSAVADRLGLRDRGLLRAGMAADVVLFDPATIADRATYEDPHQLSVGVRDVWVNGQRVLRDSTHTGAMPGRFIKGPGAG